MNLQFWSGVRSFFVCILFHVAAIAHPSLEGLEANCTSEPKSRVVIDTTACLHYVISPSLLVRPPVLSQALCEVKKTFQLEHPGTSCVEIRQDEKLFMSGGWDHR